jgi:hypothetical protein
MAYRLGNLVRTELAANFPAGLRQKLLHLCIGHLGKIYDRFLTGLAKTTVFYGSHPMPVFVAGLGDMN